MSKRRLREAACPLCGGREARHLVTSRGHEVVRCQACSLVFVWPQPPAEELTALYARSDYHAEVDEAERRRAFARRLREIGRLAPALGRLLDVGCSRGYFLEAAQSAGWQAVGVEVNPRAVEAARARGLDARPGDLAAQAFEPESFDLVTLFDVLEHVPQPLALLAECRRVLRPGGLLVVTTPDVGGLVPRLTWLLFGRTLGAWGHPTPPGHLVEFSRRTLRRALAAEGFELIRQRSEHIPVAYSAGKLENAIMDVLAGRHRKRECGRRNADGGMNEGYSASRVPYPALRKLPRLCVRLACWAVVGAGGILARALAWGDSCWMAARRPIG